MAKKAGISLCMIAQNEEQWIADAIKSVSQLVLQIILVDTGSKDKTIEIAKGLGAEVIESPWENDFSAARNLGLEKAKEDWILVLDADERIDSKDLDPLRELTKDKSKCYRFTQRNYKNNFNVAGFMLCKGEYPEWEKAFAGYSRNMICRFFPNSANIRYRGRVHETVEESIIKDGSLKILNLALPIHHYGQCETLISQRKKNEFYLNINRIKAYEQPENWKAWYEYGTSALILRKFPECAEAFHRALQLQTKIPHLYRSYGIALCELGRNYEALVIFTKGLEIAPNDAEAHFCIANCYLAVGNLQSAELHLKQALAINPSYVSAHCLIGLVYCISARSAAAIKSLTQALKLLPNCADALCLLNKSYLDSNLPNEARQVLEQLRQYHPGYSAPSIFKLAFT